VAGRMGVHRRGGGDGRGRHDRKLPAPGAGGASGLPGRRSGAGPAARAGADLAVGFPAGRRLGGGPARAGAISAPAAFGSAGAAGRHFFRRAVSGRTAGQPAGAAAASGTGGPAGVLAHAGAARDDLGGRHAGLRRGTADGKTAAGPTRLAGKKHGKDSSGDWSGRCWRPSCCV